MLFLDEFGWRVCRFVAVALFCGSTVSLSWASNREAPKPCTSQSIGKSIGESASERIAESEDSHSAEPLRVDPAERNRAAKRSVADGFCAAYFAHNLVSDQKTIWTSPLHLQALNSTDKGWLVPLGVGTLGLVAADQDILRHFGNSPMAHSSSFTNYGLAAMVGGAASLYLRGTISHDDHSRETGFLAGEAAVNSLVVGEAMKVVFQRNIPGR